MSLESFITSLKRSDNHPLIESIIEGYNTIFKPLVKWKVPDLQEEMEEIDRTIEDIKKDEGIYLSKDAFIDEFNQSSLVDLTDGVWGQLENTDSATMEPGDMTSAVKLSEKYDRNIMRIVMGIKGGNTIPAPIILKGDVDWYYLVAGNTRLMAAKALNVRPKVIIVNMVR